MIRINLLPFRAARKQENVRRQLGYLLLGLLLTLAGLTVFNISLGNKIDSLSAKIETTKKQVEKYRRDALEVDEIKKKLATLKKKTEVINNLENNRQWPVRLMDTMTQVVVQQRMWLTRFAVRNNALDLNGIAIDNKTVADFMTRLEKTGLFADVALRKLEQKVIGSSNLKQFQISCQLGAPAGQQNQKKGDAAPAKKK